MAYADTLMEAPEFGLTHNATGDELYRVGLVYAAGMGVEADYIAAHKWFNLAARAGNAEAKLARRELTQEMSQRELREAQKAARSWLKAAH